MSRLHRATLVGAALATIAAVTSGCAAKPTAGAHAPVPVATAGATSPATAPPDSPIPTVTVTATPTVTVTVTSSSHTAACAAADFGHLTVVTDGAMGSAFHTFTLTYLGSHACTLAAKPSLWYTSGGTVKALPFDYTAAGPTSLTLHTNDKVALALRTVNGYGGYSPTSGACAHPVHYSGLKVKMADGVRISLGSTTLDVLCEGVSTTGWAV